MATQTRSPGNIVEGNIYGAGSYHWTNIGNLASSNNVWASVQRTGSGYYPYTPVCTDFGFTIPVGAAINSISVTIEAMRSKTGPTITRIDWVSLMSGGVPIPMHASCVLPADVTPDMPLAEAEAVYTIVPGSYPLWGTTWTPAEINSATFGCAFDCMIDVLNVIIYADHVQIIVDYTEDTPPVEDCYSRPCTASFESMEMAIKAMIAKLITPEHPFLGCVGLKLALHLKECEDLTELKECATAYTLEEAFKAALQDDGCGGASLRIFLLDSGRGGPQ